MDSNGLFDEDALLASVEGDRNDAKALLEAAVFGMDRLLEKMREDIARRDLQEVLTDAANMHGLSIAIESMPIGLAAEHLATMALSRNLVELDASFKDLECGLKELENCLRLKSWLP